MARIVLAPYGSLGDLHPFLALALELRERGHEPVICTLGVYREKIDLLGFEFFPLRPDLDPDDRELARRMMDARTGSERIVRELMLGNIRPMYEDLMRATEGADALVPGEIVFAARSVAEKRGLKLITTTLAPLSMFSTYDPNVYPNAQFLRHLNFLGRPFHMLVYRGMSRIIGGWLEEYRRFRSEIGLDADHDPVVRGKFSDLLHLAMFSKVLGRPQPDWPASAVQTGFCFYDGRRDEGRMPAELEEFLAAGEAPIVFTLGSAAVMDAGDFFEESLAAAKMLGRRAVVLYGVFNRPPEGLDADRVGFDYAPFGEVFPRAACVVHQGGVGTTAQTLRAGVPALIMPYSHDQPDNAARCVRLGVARTVSRERYTAAAAALELRELLGDLGYKAKAGEVRSIIAGEDGTRTACDAIGRVLE